MGRTIEQITKMFSFKEEVIRHSYGRTIVGFLLPPRDCSIHDYGEACLKVIGRVMIRLDKSKYPLIGIGSIDDSGCTIRGKVGGTDKDVDRVIEFLKEGGLHCPDKKEMDLWCMKNGFYAEYW